jgi:phage terminase Nu1 subunit (DNA packaging protein)
MSKPSSTKTRAKKPRAKHPQNKTTAQIASILDVDAATVLRWCGEGLPHQKSTNRKTGNLYDLAEVRAWMESNRRSGAVGRPADEGTEDFAAWHTLKEKALALRRVRENEIADGKWIDRQAEERRDVQKLAVLRSSLCGMGATISPQLEGLNAAERQELIDRSVENILQQLAAP